MSAVLELHQISKAFPGVQALQDIDLTLRAGSIHALVGENGAGKSTLINILSGVLRPEHGVMHMEGKEVHFHEARAARHAGIVTLHQEVDLFPNLTVAENMGLEQGLPTRGWGWINWQLQRRHAAEALQAIGAAIAPGCYAGDLTPAQRQLVEIAAAVARTARVLILDEPTSSLSGEEATVLFEHLRRFRAQGTAIVYVSHRLEEIFALADDVTVLRDGKRVWTGPLVASSPAQLIARMVGREVATSPVRTPRPTGSVRLCCRKLTAVDGRFSDITLEVRAGEVLGLYGLIGAGRSEWAQGIFGLRRLAGGTVEVDGASIKPAGPGRMIRAGVAYLPEDRLRQGLCGLLSVRANSVLASLRKRAVAALFSSRALEARQTASMVRQLSVRLHSIEQRVGTLSGGNQQKVVLGRWLACEPRVLILDEPTRGVDVGAKAEIHRIIQQLADQGLAVVLISSDLSEVVAQSDRIGVFREGKLARFFDAGQATPEDIAAAALPVSNQKIRSDDAAKEQGTPAIRAARSRARIVLPELREAGLLGVVLLLYAVLQWQTGAFLESGNVRNILTDTALLSFGALGATLVILAGGLDISLGAIMALSAACAGTAWVRGVSFPLVLLIALGTGGLCGMMNAALSLVGRVHPIVVTLGTMSVYRGLTLWWLKEDLSIDDQLRSWMHLECAGVSLTAWFGLLSILLTWVFLRQAVAGRELYAQGDNPAAAIRVGISRARTWIRAFTLQGVLAGLGGLLLLGRSGYLQSTSHEERTLGSIAAAVVGGVAITGGRGSVWGVLFGCLFLVSLRSSGVALHIPAHWQQALVGGLMVLAVLFDTLWRRQRS